MKKRIKKQLNTLMLAGLVGVASVSHAALYNDLDSHGTANFERNPWIESDELLFSTNINHVAYGYLAEAMGFLKQKNSTGMDASIKKAKQSFLVAIAEQASSTSYNGLLKIALLEKNYKEADKRLHQSLLINSANAETIYLQARLLMAQGQYSQAGILLEKVVKNNDSYKLAYIALAEIAVRNKQYSLAEEHYKRVLDLDKEIASAYTNLAVIYEALGKNKTAIDVLLKGYTVLQSDANKGVYLAMALAKLYVENNEPKKALQLSLSVFERFPDNGDALNLYLDTLIINNKQFHAESLLEKRAVKNTQDIQSRLQLIVLLSKDEANKAKVVKLYREVIAVTKDNPNGYLRLTHYLLNNKEYAEVEKVVLDVRKQFPDSNMADVLMAESAVSQGNKSLAVQSYLDAYHKSKNNNLLVKVVQTLNAAGKKEQAVVLLMAEIKGNNSTAARVLLAGIYLSNKQFDKAESQYRSVLKNNPEHYIALNDLAWLLGDRNRDKEALPLAEKAYAIAPNSVDVIDTYSTILKRLGFNDKATKLIKQ